MASNNWERVSYGKKNEKLTKHDRKRINENMPRLQDLNQAQRSAVYQAGSPVADNDDLDLAAYSGSDQQQQQHHQASQARTNGAAGAHARNGGGGGDGNPGVASDSRQQQPQSQNQQPARAPASGAGGAASGKRQPANNIEVLQSLSLIRLEHAYQRSKDTIPDSPLAWLIDICAIVDLDMAYDKKEEWNRSDLNFPSNHLPVPCRQFLVRLLEAVSDDVKRRFFLHGCQRLVKQAERQAGALGTRAVMQLALRLLPQMPGHETCRPKLKELFDSARGTRGAFAALMWALGQAAYRDRATGLQALIDCALPADGGQLLATRWAAPDLLDALDELARDPAVASAKLTLSHAVALGEAAATAPPGQTRDRLLRALARLRPAWTRLTTAAAAGADADTARHLLATLRRWELPTTQPTPPPVVVDLVWQCLTDCLRGCPALLAALDPLERPPPSAQVDLRLAREALAAGDPWRLGRQARTMLAARILAAAAATTAAVPADVAQLAAGVAAAEGGRGRRRGGCLGGVCTAALNLIGALALVAMVTGCALFALAYVPRERMPSAIHPLRDYLEDRFVLYHVRRLHGDLRAAYSDRVAPFLMRRWDELANLYHDHVAPIWRHRVAPHLAAGWAATREFCTERALPWLLWAWLAACDSVATGYSYTEAQMRLHFPELVSSLGKAADSSMDLATQFVIYLSDSVKSLQAKVMSYAAA